MNEKISAQLFNPDTQMWDQIYGAVLYDQRNVFFYTNRDCSMANFIGDAISMEMKLLKKGLLLYTFTVSSHQEHKTTKLKADRFTAKKILSAI